MNLFEEFKRNRIEHSGDAAFLVASGDRSVPITWKEFTDDIEAVSWVIKKYVSQGTVALLGENSYEWIVAHAALVFSGAKVVPLEVTLSAEDVAERLSFTGAKILIHSSLYFEKAREVKRLLPHLTIGGFGSRRSEFFIGLGRSAMKSGEEGLFSGPGPNEQDISMLVYTSGTTSDPRAAEQTLEGLGLFCDVWKGRLDMQYGDHSLMVLPTHHIFGICVVYLMLSCGVVLGVCPDFHRLYDAVERFRANFLFLVPALADILATKIVRHAPTAEGALGTPLRWVLTGGAPLSQKTYAKLRSLGINPLCAYGLTETMSLYSITPCGDKDHACSAGKIADDPRVETKVSSDGELMIRGANVFKGYHKKAAKTREVLSEDGWFNTGDYGKIDEDGFVWIIGRASRTIVLSSGKKVAPEELEEKIMALPGVNEVMVSKGELSRDIKAEVFASISIEKLRTLIDELNETLPLYKRIREVVPRSEPFTRTASGKIKLGKLNEAIEEKPTVADGGKAKKSSIVFSMAGFALLAVIVTSIGIIPNLMRALGVDVPLGVLKIFEFLDIFSEGLLIVLFIIKIIAVMQDKR